MFHCKAHCAFGFGSCPFCEAEAIERSQREIAAQQLTLRDLINEGVVRMKAPTQEQLRDPEWWDRVAPEWASSFGLAGIPRNPVFYNLKQYQYPDGRRVIDLGETHTYALGDIEHVASRPTKPAAPEWDGEGLPPVGEPVRCQMDAAHWVGGRVVGHDEEGGIPVAVCRVLDSYYAFPQKCLKPFCTKEQQDRPPEGAQYIAVLPDNTMAFWRKDGEGSWQIWGPHSGQWLFDGYANDAGEPPYELKEILSERHREQQEVIAEAKSLLGPLADNMIGMVSLHALYDAGLLHKGEQ